MLFKLYTKKKYATILPIFRNKTILVYNGKDFIKLKIKNSMIHDKFGKYLKTKRKKSFK